MDQPLIESAEKNPSFLQQHKKKLIIAAILIVIIIVIIILIVLFTEVLPKDCEVSDWSNWGTCIDGKSERTRTITKPNAFGGKECPELSEKADCNDCQVSAWTDWGACVDGKSGRNRVVTLTAKNGGRACPELSEKRDCNDCEVSAWTDWGACVDGKSTRTRSVTKPAVNGGKACPELVESRDCNDCEVSAWTDWGACVDGKSTRARIVTKPAVNGGKACPELVENRDCNDCEVSAWTDWGSCIDGKSTSTRSVTKAAVNGGKECPTLSQSRDCNDCEVSAWTDWGACVDGKSNRNRTVTRDALYGMECPHLSEDRDCNDCQVSDWSTWSECVAGVSSRNRTVTLAEKNGGKACPALTETEECIYKVTNYNNTFYLEVCNVPTCVSGPGTGYGYASLTPGIYSGRALAIHLANVLNNFYRSRFNAGFNDLWRVSFDNNSKRLAIMLMSSKQYLNIIWNNPSRNLPFFDFIGLRNFVNQRRAIPPNTVLMTDPLVNNLDAPDNIIPTSINVTTRNNRYIIAVRRISDNVMNTLVGTLPTGNFTPAEIAVNFQNSVNAVFNEKFNNTDRLLETRYNNDTGSISIKIMPNYRIQFIPSMSGSTANFILGLESKTMEKSNNNVFSYDTGLFTSDTLTE